jgi:preprotein translocase subunit SecG
MNYEQKSNAIARLIILLSVLGYILTSSTKILITGFITLIVIFAVFKSNKQKITKEMMNEAFTVKGNQVTGLYENKKPATTTNPTTLETVLKSEFKAGTKKNPFSNVLLTEIMDDPDRKAAQPSFNPDVDEEITKDVKRSVQFMNPDIKNTNKQLFGDLYEDFNLDQSNRVFFSTANTRVNSDQSAFGKFLYGDMPSAKESNAAGNLQREKDSFRYTLY